MERNASGAGAVDNDDIRLAAVKVINRCNFAIGGYTADV